MKEKKKLKKIWLMLVNNSADSKIYDDWPNTSDETDNIEDTIKDIS